jgi:putative flippase GtrA
MLEKPVYPLMLRGQKRRFLLLGGMNALITNLALQLMLLVAPIVIATFFSQVINMILGYLLYGKLVFNVSERSVRTLLAFACVSLFVWCLNWFGILALVSLGFTKNLGALILVPLLPIASYLLQKYLVFSR